MTNVNAEKEDVCRRR